MKFPGLGSPRRAAGGKNRVSQPLRGLRVDYDHGVASQNRLPNEVREHHALSRLGRPHDRGPAAQGGQGPKEIPFVVSDAVEDGRARVFGSEPLFAHAHELSHEGRDKERLGGDGREFKETLRVNGRPEKAEPQPQVLDGRPRGKEGVFARKDAPKPGDRRLFAGNARRRRPPVPAAPRPSGSFLHVPHAKNEVAPPHEGGGFPGELRTPTQEKNDVEKPCAPEGPETEAEGCGPGPVRTPGVEGGKRKRGRDDASLPGGAPERQGPPVGVVRGVRAPEGIRPGTKKIPPPRKKGALFFLGKGRGGRLSHRARRNLLSGPDPPLRDAR